MEATARRSGGALGALLLMATAIILAMSIMIIPALGEVRTGSHAVERHGKDAHTARDMLKKAGPEHRWKCPDGRDLLIIEEAGRWAIGVYEDGVEVTAFFTKSQSYVKSKIEGCTNPWRFAHP